MVTYNNLKLNDQSNYYWKYYKHYEKYNRDDIRKYKRLYLDTRKKIKDIDINKFSPIIDAWIEDMETHEILGPEFSMAVCEYLKTCDDEAIVPNDWFIEAAFRDVIHDIVYGQHNEQYDKLRKLLDKSEWIRKNVLKFY